MTTASARAPRRRITQAERRAETRAALLDATIESLVAHGYAKTTTGRIADLAGVSRGAQIPYFRSRADLVSAAVAHLAEERLETWNTRFSDEPASLEECLDALWEEHQGRLFSATLELWVASRTDPELLKELQRTERRVLAAIARTAEATLGESASRPGFGDDLVFALASIRGVALLRLSTGASSRAVAERWQQTRERLVRLLG